MARWWDVTFVTNLQKSVPPILLACLLILSLCVSLARTLFPFGLLTRLWDTLWRDPHSKDRVRLLLTACDELSLLPHSPWETESCQQPQEWAWKQTLPSRACRWDHSPSWDLVGSRIRVHEAVDPARSCPDSRPTEAVGQVLELMLLSNK